MDIESELTLHMNGKGLHVDHFMLFGRPLLKIPKWWKKFFFKHDIHHLVTGFGSDLEGELKLLCWEVGAGMPWYMVGEKYIKFPLMFVFKPSTALAAFKLGRTQNSLYTVNGDVLRTKTLEEVKHYVETGQF